MPPFNPGEPGHQRESDSHRRKPQHSHSRVQNPHFQRGIKRAAISREKIGFRSLRSSHAEQHVTGVKRSRGQESQPPRGRTRGMRNYPACSQDLICPRNSFTRASPRSASWVVRWTAHDPRAPATTTGATNHESNPTADPPERLASDPCRGVSSPTPQERPARYAEPFFDADAAARSPHGDTGR